MHLPAVESIAVLGAGYVGLTTACGLAHVGNHVVAYDIDAGKVAQMQAGQCPILEAGLPDRLSLNLHAGRLRFTADLAYAVANSRMFFVCVPTLPGPGGQADVRLVQSVVSQIVELIGPVTGAQSPGSETDRPADRPLIVIKSTVPPGTTDELARIHAAAKVEFAVNPEFLKEGTAVADFDRPDRVVIGVATDAADVRLRRVYAPFVRNEHPIVTVSRSAAEAIKYAANIMLAGRISLINELANICKLLGVDINDVRRGIGYDRRIGFEFLYPGIGFGGSCLPKDLAAVIQLAGQNGYHARLLSAIADINRDQRLLPAQWLADAIGGDLDGRIVAIWGLSYKPGTADIREAPAIELIEQFLQAGLSVRVHDPAANAAVHGVFADRIQCFDDQYAALQGADALVICTEWGPFRRPDFHRIKSLLARPIILDGRNLYEPQLLADLGFEYHSVGRPTISPKI